MHRKKDALTTAINENVRLDLRRALEELIGPELANAAMEATPNIDYTDLATNADGSTPSWRLTCESPC